MATWSGPFIGLLVCFVLVSLLVLLVRSWKTATKRRVTFQDDLEEESVVVDIDSDNYGAAGNKVSEGWCDQEEGMEKRNGFDDTLACSDLEMEKAESLMETNVDEQVEEEEVKETLKVDSGTGDAEDEMKQNGTNLQLEKEAMMAIKEQSVELERYEASGSKPKSGMRKVLEKFPFLKNFSSEDQKFSAESVMTLETSKPDFLDAGLPSYNEATQVVDEKTIDEAVDPVADENVNEEISGEELKDDSELASKKEAESTDSVVNTPENNGDLTEADNVEEATGTADQKNMEQKQEEKKSRFRFSMFNAKK